MKEFHSILHFLLREVPVPKTEAEIAAEAVEAKQILRTPSAKVLPPAAVQVLYNVQELDNMYISMADLGSFRYFHFYLASSFVL